MSKHLLSPPQRDTQWRRWSARVNTNIKTLVGVQMTVGITAVAGGAALVAVPTGRLLSAAPSVLAHTGFSDFLVSGIPRAVCIGGGGCWRLC
jgi:hypothetical protein